MSFCPPGLMHDTACPAAGQAAQRAAVCGPRTSLTGMRRFGRIWTPPSASCWAAWPLAARAAPRLLPVLLAAPFFMARTASSYSLTAVPRSTPACMCVYVCVGVLGWRRSGVCVGLGG